MKIFAGQHLEVEHKRKGAFRAIALADFDTEVDEFYPIATLEYKSGMANDWDVGEKIPCRRGLAILTVQAGEGER